MSDKNMTKNMIEEYMNFTEKTIFPFSTDNQLFVKRIEKLSNEGVDIARLMTAAIGLNDESGEFLGVVKKIVFHGKEYDRERLIDELSDVLWYISHALKALDIDLLSLIEYNMAKLENRYRDTLGKMEEHENVKNGTA